MPSDHPTHPDSLVARLAKLPRAARERIRTAAMMTEARASAAIARKDRPMNAEEAVAILEQGDIPPAWCKAIAALIRSQADDLAAIEGAAKSAAIVLNRIKRGVAWKPARRGGRGYVAILTDAINRKPLQAGESEELDAALLLWDHHTAEYRVEAATKGAG